MKAFGKLLRWRLVLLVAALTPPCRRIARIASNSYEQPLGMTMRIRLRLHLLVCAACERYVRQLELLHRAAVRSREKPAHHLSRARLGAEAKARLKARLMRTGPP